MLKLIQLEIKKFRLFDYWPGVLIANVGFIAFLSMIFFIEKNDGNIPFENFDMVMSIGNSIIRATFLIFSSIIMVKLVIDEYKNKSIDIMFTYPISRKKIMWAKLIIIVFFTFITIMLSTLFIGALIYLLDTMYNIIPGGISVEDIYRNLMASFLGALASAGLSLIPLFFGMRKKSAPATIVSSIILVTLSNSTGNNFTLFSFIAIPISLGLIGILIGYLTVRNIEYVDI
ncbi:ABC transporter permease [Lysinibacillus sp. RS5]|uniref:ABC transporter permease n=1 Tax=unclassified Lysinibacillus TaxID=2636778 RepID=UPI0035BE6CAA